MNKIMRPVMAILRILQAELQMMRRYASKGMWPARIATIAYINLRYRARMLLGPDTGKMRKSYPHLHIAHLGPRPDMLIETRATRIDRLPISWITPASHDALLATCGPTHATSRRFLDYLGLFRQAGVDVVVILEPETQVSALPPDLATLATLICTPTITQADALLAQGYDAGQILTLPPAVNTQKISPAGFPVQGSGDIGVICKAGNAADRYGNLPVPCRQLAWAKPGQLPRLAKAARKMRAVICDPALCPPPADFAQQVITLAAAGAVILYPAHARDQLAPLIGPDAGMAFETGDDLQRIIDQLADAVTRERESVTARRHILTHHSHTQRLEQLLRALGIPTRPRPLVSLIACTMRPDYLPRFLSMVRDQDWPNMELVLITHGANFDPAEIARLLDGYPIPVNWIKCPKSMIFGDCLNAGIFAARGQYIAKIDDDDFYGPSHIRDLVQAHDYANAPVTGKSARFIYLARMDILMQLWAISEARLAHVSGAAFMLTRDIARDYMFLLVSRGIDATLFERVAGDGRHIYASHATGFCVFRGGTDHTWHHDDEAFLATATRHWQGFNHKMIGLSESALIDCMTNNKAKSHDET